MTADHGFIYQNKTIEESDYLGTNASGEEILYDDRRFILGRNLHEEPSFKRFTSNQLGLVDDIETLIPKSINRLKKSGSSSKFVHGGATLQEIVIPVIQIHKKRKSDTAHVEIDIIRGSSSIISSGQLSVTFYQKDAVYYIISGGGGSPIYRGGVAESYHHYLLVELLPPDDIFIHIMDVHGKVIRTDVVNIP